MYNFLAFNTSTDICSVLLTWNNKIYLQEVFSPKNHNSFILPLIQNTLLKAEASLKDIDAFIVGNGPGSFVGVRISIGILKGIGLVLDTPIIAVSSLQAISQGIYKKFSDKKIWVLLNYSTYQVYSQKFILKKGIMQPQDNIKILKKKDICFFQKEKFVPVGNGWIEISILKNSNIINIKKINWKPRIIDMLSIAHRKYTSNIFYNIDNIDAIY